LQSYTDFDWEDLPIDEQEFEDYKASIRLVRKVKQDTQKQRDFHTRCIDFELELIHRDQINVAYILKLLAQLKEKKELQPLQKKPSSIYWV
jgi:type I restriction enzyme R subunit